MAITVEAIYENGVLRPVQDLPLAEHERVRVTVETQTPRKADGDAAPPVPAPLRPSLAERIAARVRALPPEVVDSWPTDGASQHDHYIYGTPKRPE